MSALIAHVKAFRALSTAFGAEAARQPNRSASRRALVAFGAAYAFAASELDQQIRDEASRLDRPDGSARTGDER